MFHSIISDYDVFFAGWDQIAPTGTWEGTQSFGAEKASRREPCKSNVFFSTDPKDYLKMV